MRKKRINRSVGDEEEITNGFFLRCFNLYGRGGGCRVGVGIGDDFGDLSGRRRLSVSEEGKGYKIMCGVEEIGVDCFLYGRKERFWKRSNRRELEFDVLERNRRLYYLFFDDILEMCLMRFFLLSFMNVCLVCKKWNYLVLIIRFM